MDTEDDSYFMLEPDDEAAFLANLRAMGKPSSETACIAGFARPITLASWEPPQKSILSGREARQRPSLGDLLLAWRLVATARRRIRHQPIPELLARLESGSEVRTAGMAGPSAAARFAAARRFVPVPRNCLLDSVGLLLWLERGGERATLLFGVKLNPFGAHCWVQSGSLLLNDHVEHVERFTPVRAINCLPVSP